MRKILLPLGLFLLAGCLTIQEESVALWPIEYHATAKPQAAKPVYALARLSNVIVCSPYNDKNIAVLRANGTMAFDAFNEFAAVPSALLKRPTVAALEQSGIFEAIVGASSLVSASTSIEIVISRLALDCRTKDTRDATVELIVRIIDNRRLVATKKGRGTAGSADGDFGAAFSKAYSAALDDALAQLR